MRLYQKGDSYLTITNEMQMTCKSSLYQKKKKKAKNPDTDGLHENQAKEFIVRSINLLYPSKKRMQHI